MAPIAADAAAAAAAAVGVARSVYYCCSSKYQVANHLAPIGRSSSAPSMIRFVRFWESFSFSIFIFYFFVYVRSRVVFFVVCFLLKQCPIFCCAAGPRSYLKLLPL